MAVKRLTSGGNKILGFSAGIGVVLIWAVWLVVSRSGAISVLTIFDLAALRYGVSFFIAFPLVLYFKPWINMKKRHIVYTSFLLSPIYILCVFGGFTFASAAHGGIFMNGAIPVITLLISMTFLSKKLLAVEIFGILLILTGSIFALIDEHNSEFQQSWVGDLLFLVGAVFFSIYIIVSRMWNIDIFQVFLCGSVINSLFYLPIWYFFLPSSILNDLSFDTNFIIQMIYQGIVPNLVGFVLVSYASRTIGTSITAALMAAVPAIGTILSVLILFETPGVFGVISLFILIPGIVVVALKSENV